jgi:predicted Zn-dependent protease
MRIDHTRPHPAAAAVIDSSLRCGHLCRVTSAESATTGTLGQALQHTRRLLNVDPALAETQAGEILKVAPGHPIAQLLLSSAQRLQGRTAEAATGLQQLVEREPRAAAVRLELGLALGALGRGTAAIDALKAAVALKPDLAEAWRALGDHALAIGDSQLADQAYAKHLRFSARDPRVASAAAALLDQQIAIAEANLRDYLKEHPTDVAAIRMLAEVAARLGRYGDAENLLTRCLELAPGFRAARHNYAYVLHRASKSERALQEIDSLLTTDPKNPGYRSLRAAVLARIGETQQSIELYRELLQQYPNQARAWMSLGHALRAAGEQTESIEAYRKTIELQPSIGEAWWSLANLKTFEFSDADVTAMQTQLARPDLTAEDRFHFDFSLGKAFEDRADYARAFVHVQAGNEQRRKLISYDADETSAQVQRAKALFTPEFLRARAAQGSTAADPIFVIGLPRSGSTLIEQILASHPQVEGTQELPDILAIARRLSGKRTRGDPSHYPEVLGTLGAEELRALGERYLAQTRIQRKTDRPCFIDKMPNNWAHVGLIHLILPQAKIIDARRHPLGCCWSGFKQHFARGQHFSYSLTDIGRYYRDYVELLAHFDGVLPGRVHRIFYENMVEDTENEVRRVLDYCGLPFDARCLEFYRNERAVRTASSEQVRQPIFRDALEHWRHFDPWLGPLRDALGPLAQTYPLVPKF